MQHRCVCGVVFIYTGGNALYRICRSDACMSVMQFAERDSTGGYNAQSVDVYAALLPADFATGLLCHRCDDALGDCVDIFVRQRFL